MGREFQLLMSIRALDVEGVVELLKDDAINWQYQDDSFLKLLFTRESPFCALVELGNAGIFDSQGDSILRVKQLQYLIAPHYVKYYGFEWGLTHLNETIREVTSDMMEEQENG